MSAAREIDGMSRASRAAMAVHSTVLQQSWLRTSNAAPCFTPSFLEALSWRYPSAFRLIERIFGGGEGLEERVDGFARTLADHIDDPEWLGATFAMLTASYPEMHEVPPHVVGWIRDVLLETMERSSGAHWTSEERAAWFEVLESTREEAAELLVRGHRPA